MARSSMTSLIGRLRALLNSDAGLDDDALEQLLDAHSFAIDTALVPRAPFFTEHEAPYDNIEAGAIVYVGYNTMLVAGSDYTIDLVRGIVTTAAADHRMLMLQGRAYDLNAAAADGWEQIAGAEVGAFDFSDLQGRYSVSQIRAQALEMAATYRAKAWATDRLIARADSTLSGADAAERLRQGFRRQVW